MEQARRRRLGCHAFGILCFWRRYMAVSNRKDRVRYETTKMKAASAAPTTPATGRQDHRQIPNGHSAAPRVRLLAESAWARDSPTCRPLAPRMAPRARTSLRAAAQQARCQRASPSEARACPLKHAPSALRRVDRSAAVVAALHVAGLSPDEYLCIVCGRPSKAPAKVGAPRVEVARPSPSARCRRRGGRGGYLPALCVRVSTTAAPCRAVSCKARWLGGIGSS